MTFPITFRTVLRAAILQVYSKNHARNLDEKIELTKLERNLLYAKEAMEYAAEALPLGAVNRSKDIREISPDLLLKMFNLRTEIKLEINQITAPHYNLDKRIEVIARIAKKYQIGNCTEHCAVAYLYLKNEKNLRKVELLALVRGDHCFVVIGRKPGSDVTDPSSWGKSAVICEPWGKTYYQAIQIFDQLNKISARTLYDPSIHTIGWQSSGKVPTEEIIYQGLQFHQSKNKKQLAEKTIQNYKTDESAEAQAIKSCMQDYLDRKNKPKIPPISL